MDVGTVIEKYRKRSGLTQKELADIAGFHVNSIQKWESGETIPVVDKFMDVMNALGCDMRIEKGKPITKIIEEVAENICDNFCKFRDTCDDNCECEWIRQGNDCPLDRLY